jgi:hypothetical protein
MYSAAVNFNEVSFWILNIALSDTRSDSCISQRVFSSSLWAETQDVKLIPLGVPLQHPLRIYRTNFELQRRPSRGWWIPYLAKWLLFVKVHFSNSDRIYRSRSQPWSTSQQIGAIDCGILWETGGCFQRVLNYHVGHNQLQTSSAQSDNYWKASNLFWDLAGHPKWASFVLWW